MIDYSKVYRNKLLVKYGYASTEIIDKKEAQSFISSNPDLYCGCDAKGRSTKIVTLKDCTPEEWDHIYLAEMYENTRKTKDSVASMSTILTVLMVTMIMAIAVVVVMTMSVAH